MEKVGTQAVQEPRIRAEKPETGGRAVTLDGETVDSGSATRIWDGQPGAQAVNHPWMSLETQTEGWGSQGRNREFSSGTGSSGDETRGSDKGTGCSIVEIWESGRETEN